MHTYALTDSSLMPFGKYKNKTMANVPAVYLLWLYNNGCDHAGVKRYIIDNMQALIKEANAATRR